MINGLENAPTGRAKCVRCHNLIPQGELRGTEYNEEFHTNRYYCKHCAYIKIGEDIANLTKLKQELEMVGV